MSDYIEREAVNALIEAECSPKVAAFLNHAIDNIPAADVRPVLRGKWTMNSDFPDRLICSECGAQFDVWHWEAKQMHFCPNCGADMRETNDEKA